MSRLKFISVVAAAFVLILQSSFAHAQTELETWRSHMSPAGDAHLAGDYGVAERHYVAALELAEKFDTDGQYLEASLSGLAGLYFAQGRYADAALRFRQAISIAEALYDPDDPKRSSLDLYRELLIESEAQQRRVAIPERGISPTGQKQQAAQPIPPLGAVAAARPATVINAAPAPEPSPIPPSPPVTSLSVSSLPAPSVPLTGIQQAPVPTPELLDPEAVRRPVPVPPSAPPAPPIVASAPPAPAAPPQPPVVPPPAVASAPVAKLPDVVESVPAVAEATPRLPGPVAPPDSSPPPPRGTAPIGQLEQLTPPTAIAREQPLPPTATAATRQPAPMPAPAPQPSLATAPEPDRLVVNDNPQQTPVAAPEPLETTATADLPLNQASDRAPIEPRSPAPEAPETIAEPTQELATAPAPKPEPELEVVPSPQPSAAEPQPGILDWVRSLIPEPTPESASAPDDAPEAVAKAAPEPTSEPVPELVVETSEPVVADASSADQRVPGEAEPASDLQSTEAAEIAPAPEIAKAESELQTEPSTPTKSFLDRVRDLIPEPTPEPLAVTTAESTADAVTDNVEPPVVDGQAAEIGDVKTFAPEPASQAADVVTTTTEPDVLSATNPVTEPDPSQDEERGAALRTETSSDKGILDWIQGLLPEPTPDIAEIAPTEPAVSESMPEPASVPMPEPAAPEPVAVAETAEAAAIEEVAQPESRPESQPLPPKQAVDNAPSPELTKVRPPKLIAPEKGVIDQAPVPTPEPVLPTDTAADLVMPEPEAAGPPIEAVPDVLIPAAEFAIAPEDPVIKPKPMPPLSQPDVSGPDQASATDVAPPNTEPAPKPDAVPKSTEIVEEPDQPSALEEVLAVDEPTTADSNAAGAPRALGARGRLEKAMSQAEIARAALEDKPGVPLRPTPVRKPKGALAATEAAYKQDLTERLQRVNRNHPDAATGYYKLGRLYHRQGRYELAGGMYKKALAIREASLAPDDPQLIEAAESYAKLLRHSGLSERADALMERIRNLAKGKDEQQ